MSNKNIKDIFGLTGPATEDHIWPLAKNGSGSKKNTQILSRESNELKGDLNKGEINGIRFSVIEAGRTESDKRIGKMRVLKNNRWIDA